MAITLNAVVPTRLSVRLALLALHYFLLCCFSNSSCSACAFLSRSMKVGLRSLFLALIHSAITPTIGSTTKRTAKPPHNGAVIHHHDQSITPQSFRIRNTRNSNDKKLIDELDFVSFPISHFLFSPSTTTLATETAYSAASLGSLNLFATFNAISLARSAAYASQ